MATMLTVVYVALWLIWNVYITSVVSAAETLSFQKERVMNNEFFDSLFLFKVVKDPW